MLREVHPGGGGDHFSFSLSRGDWLSFTFVFHHSPFSASGLWVSLSFCQVWNHASCNILNFIWNHFSPTSIWFLSPRGDPRGEAHNLHSWPPVVIGVYEVWVVEPLSFAAVFHLWSHSLPLYSHEYRSSQSSCSMFSCRTMDLWKRYIVFSVSNFLHKLYPAVNLIFSWLFFKL